MVYFNAKDFDIVKFSNSLKLGKQKRIRIQNIFREQTYRFTKNWNGETIIDFAALKELIDAIKSSK